MYRTFFSLVYGFLATFQKKLHYSKTYGKMETETCFLCKCTVLPENICKECNDSIYYCSEAHLEAHRGSIRTGKNTAKVK